MYFAVTLRRLVIMIITRFKATLYNTLKESCIYVRIVLRNKANVKNPVVRFYVLEDGKRSLMSACKRHSYKERWSGVDEGSRLPACDAGSLCK